MKTLLEFFSGDKTFKIPSYQRDYAWEAENIEDIFNDIQEAIETNTNHFIGTFILSKNENESEYKIVDGQQRLTTLYMLLSVIVKQLDETRKAAFTFLFITNTDGSKKLILSGHTAKFFDDLLSDMNPTPTDKGQKRLAEAYKKISQQIAALPKESVVRWADVVKSFTVIDFVEQNEGQAIRMFQSVNDRGVPLSNMDKAKSLLIYYSNRFLDGSLDEYINEKFGDCFRHFDKIKDYAAEDPYRIDLINRADFSEDDVFRYHYLTFKYASLPLGVPFDFRATIDSVLNKYLKPILKSLQSNRDLLGKFIEFYINDLTDFFSAFEKLLNLARSKLRLYHLLIIQKLSANLYPLLIRMQVRGLLFGNHYKFLKKIFVADMRVYKIRGTFPQKDIFYLSHDAFDAPPEEVCNRLLEFVQRFMNDNAFRSSIQNQLMYNNPGLNSIFTEKELCYIKRSPEYNVLDNSDKKAFLLNKMIEMVVKHQTMEHILPQEPSFDPVEYGFNDEDDYYEVIDGVGNLTLLTEHENSSYGAKSTDSKINDVGYYKSSYYKITSQLAYDLSANGRRFTKEVVQDRANDIAVFCVTHWPLWEKLDKDVAVD